MEVLGLKLRVKDHISCHIKVLLPEGTEQTSTLHGNWTGTEREELNVLEPKPLGLHHDSLVEVHAAG